MNLQWSHHQVNPQRVKRRPRVQSACVRCRRQKLRCDQERPCSLCLRSDVECVSEPAESDRSRKRIFRGADAQDEAHTAPNAAFQDQVSQKNPVLSARGSPDDDSEDRGSLSGERHTRPANKRASMSLHSVSGTTRLQAFDERPSSVGLTQQIIDDFSPETILESSTSALPGGSVMPKPRKGRQQEQLPLDQLLGITLPPKTVTDYLLDKYFDAVHWFMTIFHEPSLRLTYDRLMSSRRCSRLTLNRARVLLLLICLGANYATEDEIRQKFPSFGLLSFRKQSLENVESSLNDLFDAAGIESIQVCVLLGSYHLYHGKPNLAFVVLGAGLQCAQLMNLHKESSWRGLSEVAKEERRRTFWALFVFDRFAATIFGKPCGLPLEDIEVKIPEVIGDKTVQHPHFKSIATMPDGSVEPVTTFSYLKFKLKFYQISSSIIGDLYFHRNPNVIELAAKVSRIHQELVEFHNGLPPELRLDELCSTPDAPVTPETRPFILQALALQVAYDNVQILLHRPLLSQDLQYFKEIKSSTSDGELNTEAASRSRSPSSRDVHQVLLSSRDRCWESAIRSSNLGKHQQCLRSARESHAAAFLGINLFTAGMVLCVIALSRPLSSQAQIAKQAVARIMALSRFLAGRVLLSAQTTKVLRDLVRLIGDKEVDVILSGSEAFENAATATITASKSSVRRPPTPSSTEMTAPVSDEQDAVSQLLDLQSQFQVQQRQQSGSTDVVPEPPASTDFDFSGLENLDFNNGLFTLQQAMFPSSLVGTPDINQTNGETGRSEPWNPEQYNAEHGFVESTSGSENGLVGTDFNMMNTVGQTWLWDSMTWNT